MLLPALFGLLIIIVSTCLVSRGFTDFQSNLIDQLRSFDYLRTYVELYFLMILNGFLLIFFSTIFSCRSFSSTRLLKYLRIGLISFQPILYIYTLSKFLIFYEWTNVRDSISPRSLDRFDILTFIFFPLFSLFGIAVWIFLFNRSNDRQTTNDPEREQLVEDESSSTEGLTVQMKKTKSSWWRIIKLGKDEWKLYILGFFFLLAAASADMFQPFFSGHIISSVVANDWHQFVRNIFWFLGISLIYVITSGLRGFILSITLTNLIQRLRDRVFASIMRQDVSFFDQTKTGEITSRLSSDITTVGEAVSLNLNIFLRSFIQAIGVITMMFILSWNLFLLALITGPLAFGTAKLYGDLMANQQKKVQDALAEANGLAEEAISTVRTVKSFANEDEEVRLFSNKNAVVRKHSIRQALYYFGYMWNAQTMTVLLNLGTLAYGGHLVMKNRLEVSGFVSFILYQQRLGDVFDSINGVYTGLMKASGASVKLFEYIDRVPTLENNGNEKPTDFRGRIEFRNVNFSFPNRKDDLVLKNVSFTVESGQQVALVGPSGSGKTTCISLLEHFYDVDQGEILIDGIPVQNYDYKFYHQKVSLVSQEPVLHARSIRDNIQYGLLDEKPMEEMIAVAQMANAHLFVSSFQNGYATECGERGVQMAGGQKQRIALARALIRSPNVLLLDEATSALDAEAEAQVQEAIARTVVGRTVLIIAHRLSTVRHADKILVLRHGEIVEEGTHLQLMAKAGLYYQLVKRQTEHYEIGPDFPAIESNRLTTSNAVPVLEKVHSISFSPKNSI